MKKIVQLSLFLALIFFSQEIVYSAVLSMGQGARWIMTGSRTASEEIDAVWFNPAGLTELPDGFHASFSHHNLYAHGYIENDTIIDSSTDNYGKMKDRYKTGGFVYYIAYIFTSFNIDDWAIFFGIEGPGGCGGGKFENGTPTEVVGFQFLKITPHQDHGDLTRIDMKKMEARGGGGVVGPSLGVAYKLNDYLSVSLKGRFLIGFSFTTAEYDVMLQYEDGYQEKFTFEDGGTEIDSYGFGYGYGFGAGLNFKPTKDLNISLVYDYFSPLDLEIKYKKGDMKMSPGSPYDGMKMRYQVPARIGSGIGYRISPDLKAMFSVDLGLDMLAEKFGDENTYKHNYVEEANSRSDKSYQGEEFELQHQYNLGFEYDINQTFMIGLGAGYMNSGYKPVHLTDFDPWTDRVDLHIGTEISFSESVKLQLAYCIYLGIPTEGDRDLFENEDYLADNVYEKGEQSTYTRTAHMFVWGVTASLFADEG